jgi:hypothetical protein
MNVPVTLADFLNDSSSGFGWFYAAVSKQAQTLIENHAFLTPTHVQIIVGQLLVTSPNIFVDNAQERRSTNPNNTRVELSPTLCVHFRFALVDRSSS